MTNCLYCKQRNESDVLACKFCGGRVEDGPIGDQHVVEPVYDYADRATGSYYPPDIAINNCNFVMSRVDIQTPGITHKEFTNLLAKRASKELFKGLPIEKLREKSIAKRKGRSLIAEVVDLRDLYTAGIITALIMMAIAGILRYL